MAASTRREVRRSDHARRGLVALMALALALGLVWLQSSGRYGGPAHVSAQLVDVGGSLTSGADVKMRGVIVGKVAEIGRGEEGGVRVRISIEEERLEKLPGNVVARVLPATVFGTSFIDLVTHEGASPEPLRPGAVIPADRTQGTLELQQALDDIDALVKALGPAELASAIGSAAQALDGRGEQLGRTIDRLDSYLARLNPKLPVLREDIRKLSANLALAEEVAPDLLAATNDALVTARTVVTEKAAIARLLSGGTTLARQAHRFLGENEADLVRFLDNAVALLDAVYDNRHAAITEALATNRMLDAKLGSILDHGFADTMVKVDLDPPEAYSAADCPRFGSARGENCAALGRAGAAWMLGAGR